MYIYMRACLTRIICYPFCTFRLLSGYARMLGVSPSIFTGAMKSIDIETVTRAAWKYSCSRMLAFAIIVTFYT